jgi:hypothetical protein
VVTEEELAARLRTFLDRRGVAVETLLGNVESSFGAPLLVVATGSVLQGFGNSRSDVDLNVVVEAEKLAALPIPSFEGDVLVDATYFGAHQLEPWVPALRDHPWPPTGTVDRDACRRRFSRLFQSSRFACGLALTARNGWDGWLEELRRPWLVQRVVEWWRTEAYRWSLGARWLRDVKPMLAAQRQCEAVIAALESRAAAAGELYFKPKWLAEKFAMLGDEAGRQALKCALRTPTRERDVDSYVSRCDELLRDLLGDSAERALGVQVWMAPGVTVRRLGGTTLVSRWDLRGVELRDADLALDGNAPIWQGGIDAEPSVQLLELFAADMTWLSLVTEAA